MVLLVSDPGVFGPAGPSVLMVVLPAAVAARKRQDTPLAFRAWRSMLMGLQVSFVPRGEALQAVEGQHAAYILTYQSRFVQAP